MSGLATVAFIWFGGAIVMWIVLYKIICSPGDKRAGGKTYVQEIGEDLVYFIKHMKDKQWWKELIRKTLKGTRRMAWRRLRRKKGGVHSETSTEVERKP